MRLYGAQRNMAYDIVLCTVNLKFKNMWNMNESDRKYYERKARQDDKRNKSLAKAKARGEAAVEWYKTNTLTKETKPIFDKLMKDTDRAFNGA
jgi:hypothetical protein